MTRKILKNWSLLTVSNVVQQGLGFLVLIPIARALELAEYGSFTLILTAIGIAQVFSSLGLRLVVIREVSRDGRNLSRIAGATLKLSLLGFFAACLPLAAYLFAVEKIASPAVLTISVFLLLAQVLWNFAEPLTFGRERMQLSSILGSAFAILWIGIVFLIPGLISDLTSLLAMSLALQLAKSLVFLILIWREGYFRHPDGGAAVGTPSEAIGYRRLLSQSLPLYCTGILAACVTQLPILFLSLNSGSVEVAYFGLGSKLSLPFVLIFGNLLNAIYPLLARSYVQGEAGPFPQLAKKLFLAVWISGIAFSFFLSLFSGEIIRLLFGVKFEAAAPSFAMLLWVTVNHLIHGCMGMIFLAADKERLMLKLSLANGLITGIAAWYGSFTGASGLAIALFIGLAVSYFIHWHVLRTLVRIPLDRVLMLCFYAAFAGLGIGSLYFPRLGLPVRSALFAIGLTPFLFAYLKLAPQIRGLLKGRMP